MSGDQNAPEHFGCQRLRVGSKKSVQQGRSRFDARSVLVIREHGKRAGTPLAAFFNRPMKAHSTSAPDTPPS